MLVAQETGKKTLIVLAEPVFQATPNQKIFDQGTAQIQLFPFHPREEQD